MTGRRRPTWTRVPTRVRAFERGVRRVILGDIGPDCRPLVPLPMARSAGELGIALPGRVLVRTGTGDIGWSPGDRGGQGRQDNERNERGDEHIGKGGDVMTVRLFACMMGWLCVDVSIVSLFYACSVWPYAGIPSGVSTGRNKGTRRSSSPGPFGGSIVKSPPLKGNI